MKQELRILLKKIRNTIDPLRKQKASNAACHTLYGLSQGCSFILSFASMDLEIDLWPLNRKLAEEGRLVLPRVDQNQLKLYHVSDCENLEFHPFGIPEPFSLDPPFLDFKLLTMAFIPGLGFDRQTKYRLGYGKGYYDRLLGEIDHVQTYGVAFLEQSVDNLPHDSYDIPMNNIHLF